MHCPNSNSTAKCGGSDFRAFPREDNPNVRDWHCTDCGALAHAFCGRTTCWLCLEWASWRHTP
jgi:hypothetical protein